MRVSIAINAVAIYKTQHQLMSLRKGRKKIGRMREIAVAGCLILCRTANLEAVKGDLFGPFQCHRVLWCRWICSSVSEIVEQLGLSE